MACPGGRLLSHENVLSIFQACFRIGHYQTERAKDMSGALHVPGIWRISLLPEDSMLGDILRSNVCTRSHLRQPENLNVPRILAS